jgi:hypothetical protein
MKFICYSNSLENVVSNFTKIVLESSTIQLAGYPYVCITLNMQYTSQYDRRTCDSFNSHHHGSYKFI